MKLSSAIRLIGEDSVSGECGAARLRARGCPTQALLKLLLINADGTGDADHAVCWNLALPDPEVNRISETLNLSAISLTFANLVVIDTTLVLSSERVCTVRGQVAK